MKASRVATTASADDEEDSAENSANPFITMANSQDNYLHGKSYTDAQAHYLLKEQWIKSKLKSRIAEFTFAQSLQVFCCTWNVNGKQCNENFEAALFPKQLRQKQEQQKSSSDFDFADLYFIGLQEVDVSAESILLNDSPREEYWDNLIRMTFHKINPSKPMVKIASKRLAGIILYAYCKENIRQYITDICTDSKGCGVLGLGNKGGVAVRFHVFNSSFCVVNSHLAADTMMLERRNADFEDISSSLSFPYSTSMPSTLRSSGSSSSSAVGANNSDYTIWDCDALIWMGDLNYRVTLPHFQVKEMIKVAPVADLLKHCQLLKEKSYEGGAFSQFEEAEITFPPSYKYDPGTNDYDTSEKKRTPSWCDRIMHRKKDPLKISYYDSIPDIMVSDHKPVVCKMTASVTVVDHSKFQTVHQSILRDMDKMENEAMPDCKISTNSLQFGDIQYLQPVSKEIIVENVGTVAAKTRFIPKLDESTICRSWLWINPPMSVLMPGDKLTIKFTILVDDNTVSKLNVAEDKLEDILILHLENGKDFFISMHGNFIPTCFGLDIRLMLKMTKSVAELRRDLPDLWKKVKDEDKLKDNKIGQGETQQIPKELWRIVDYIYRFGLGFDGLFMTSGDQQVMYEIREALDNGQDFRLPATMSSKEPEDDDCGSPENYQIVYIHSMAEILLAFLAALPNPVIPFGPHYQKCLDSYSSYALAKNAISMLPTPHYNTFVYITSFLREIIETSQSRISAPTIAALFSAVLLRTPKPIKSKYYDAVAKKKTQFLLHFLQRN